MKQLFDLLHFEFVWKWLTYNGKKRALILTLHRTTSGKVWEDIYNTSPQYLDDMFVLMKEWGFHFVSIDEALSYKPLEYPSITVVCDDGFADNLYGVVPIFRKFNIPYCIYVSTGVLLRKDVTLEAMAEYMYSYEGWKYSGLCTKKYDENVDNQINAMIDIVRCAKTLKETNYIKSNFMNENNTTLIGEMNRLYLDLNQVKEMSDDSLCTFGCHSFYHVPMKKMTLGELIYNTKEARRLLEEIIHKPVKHFAYPFGGVSDNYIREFRAVKAAGFESGGMFFNGVLTERYKKHPYRIPRIHVNPCHTPAENVRYYKRLLNC